MQDLEIPDSPKFVFRRIIYTLFNWNRFISFSSERFTVLISWKGEKERRKESSCSRKRLLFESSIFVPHVLSSLGTFLAPHTLPPATAFPLASTALENRRTVVAEPGRS